MKRLLVLATTTALIVLVLPASALAARPHEFTTTFGTPCAAAPCGPGELKEPSGVAVNEATHQVYVIDQGNSRVEIFNGQTGAPEGEIAEFEVEAGVTQTFAFGGEAENGGIAVDNSCALHQPPLTGSACEAADPSAGDLYVVERGRQLVDKFGPNGEFLGRISEGFGRATEEEAGRTEPFQDVFGVAVNAQGGLYVFEQDQSAVGQTISVYTHAAANVFSRGIAVPLEVPGLPFSGFATDAAGDFYVRDNLGPGGARITKLSPTGEILIAELDGEDSSAVVADQTVATAFVDNLTSLGVFEPDGSEAGRLGTEGGTAHLAAGAGVAVDASAGAAGSTLYVADAAAGQVVVFGPKSPTTPLLEAQSIANVNATEARIEAQINPRSEPLEAPTEYHLAYGRCATPTSCALSAYEAAIPVPDGQIPADFEPHPVAFAIAGLEPGATYHARVVARNSHGGAEALPELILTTQGAGGPLVLPDGRAWEMVSSPEKQGARIEPLAEEGVVEAAAGGGAMTYLASTPTEPDPSGYTNRVQILSARGPGSWSTRDIALPHVSTTGLTNGDGPEYKFFDPQLTQSAVQPYGEFIAALSAEASESTAYLHDLSAPCAGACFRPLVTGQPGFANVPKETQFGEEEECRPRPTGTGLAAKVVCGPQFIGATEDLAHVVLRSNVALTPGGQPAGLYEWSAGLLSPVSVLPGEVPASTSVGLGDLGSGNARSAISNDGSRIVFSTSEALYQRDMTLPKTIQLDRAEEPGGVPCSGCQSGGGEFQIASADGSRVFFTDHHRLTEDAGAQNSPTSADLYECRIVEEAGGPACRLTDLTPPHEAESADVLGRVLGGATDGSSLDFVADAVLAGANAEGNGPSAGQPNLYRLHEGTTSFIATLAAGDATDWGAELAGQPTRVSPSGRFLEVMSQGEPTGYDNRDLTTGRPVAEVYLYDATAGRLRCISCMPGGGRPTGVEYHRLESGSGGLVGGRGIWPATDLVAANVPGWTAIRLGVSRYQPRYLSDSGRLFFNSADALVPQDSNGTEDVYEYEPPQGPGQPASNSCTEAADTFSARSGGCVSLISAGTSGEESAFMDASESGDDVFFLTSSRLSGQDTDNALDVYDAHACGEGVPCLPEPPDAALPCNGEGCQNTSAPPVEASPSTSEFAGPGNPKPVRKQSCTKGKGGKCVKNQTKKSKAKSHKKHSRKKSKRANNGRRAGR